MEMAGFSSPVPPIPSHPPLFVFHCRGYQLLAANKDDKDEEDVRGGGNIADDAKSYKASGCGGGSLDWAFPCF